MNLLAPKACAGEAGELLVSGTCGVIDGTDHDGIVRLTKHTVSELPTVAVADHLCQQIHNVPDP